MTILATPWLAGVALSLVAPAPVQARPAPRTLTAVSERAGSLELTTSDGKYVLTAFSERVLQTTFIATGDQPAPPSHAVVATPQPVRTTLRQSAKQIEYATPGIVVTISRAPFKIAYSYQGRQLMAERGGYRKGAKGDSVDFTLDADEALFGGGARALGMNRRGHRLKLYNKAHYAYESRSELLNYTMPLVLSSKRYMIHFDNATAGWLDLDQKHRNVLSYESGGGRKTYQVIAGARWEELFDSYTALTGRQPLVPRWTLGNFASRFGYHSEAEARATVARFAAEGIPLDAIVFDLYWFGKEIKGSMGNLAFDRDAFPNPEGMIADFAKAGVKTVLITEPFVLTTSQRWQDAVKHKALATNASGAPYTYDFYFGNTGLIDIFSDEGRSWLWDVYRQLHQMGVRGWWGDLGEPEVHPADLLHATGTADQVHNIYGHAWAGLIAEGYRKEFPKERPFILMRAGYSGSQRFGLIPWSGDVNRSWGGLQPQPEIALQMGMQGLAYMHSDLGGFVGPTLDDELYARWLQYGVFQPVFRPHAQEEVPSEPVYRAPRALALAREAIKLRYALLPYNYTLAFENSRTGMPLMRPLMMEEPDNVRLRTLSATYLWGRELLVTPILAAGVRQQQVVFPATASWFDFYTGQRHAGGGSELVPVVDEHIPVFVRAGAFLPMAPPMASTDAYTGSELTLRYYHDRAVKASAGQLYDDDGHTAQAWEQGQFELLKFASESADGTLSIRIASAPGAAYRGPARAITLEVHNVEAAPDAVLLDGGPVATAWDPARKVLSCTLTLAAGATRTVRIVNKESKHD